MEQKVKKSLLTTVAAAALMATTLAAGAQTGRQADMPRASQDSRQMSGSADRGSSRETDRRDRGRSAQTRRPSSSENTGQAERRESTQPDEARSRGSASRPDGASRDNGQNTGQAAGTSNEADRAGNDRSRARSDERGRAERTGRRDRDHNANRGERDRARQGATTDRPSRTGGSDELNRPRQRTGERDRMEDRNQGAAPNRSQERSGREAGRDIRSSSGSVTLNERQETRIRDTIMRHGPRTATNVNFSVSVGATVPRHVHLATLPSDVVEIVPRYRGYKYVVVRDEIVIVDPHTYKVVTVIDRSGSSATTGSKPRGERLSLTREQREIVRKHAKRHAARSVDVDVTVGTEFPDEVELYPLPDEVYTEVPALRSYRYVVVDDEVVLVDPDEHRIVEVIE
jgi:hypothetical protein